MRFFIALVFALVFAAPVAAQIREVENLPVAGIIAAVQEETNKPVLGLELVPIGAAYTGLFDPTSGPVEVLNVVLHRHGLRADLNPDGAIRIQRAMSGETHVTHSPVGAFTAGSQDQITRERFCAQFSCLGYTDEQIQASMAWQSIQSQRRQTVFMAYPSVPPATPGFWNSGYDYLWHPGLAEAWRRYEIRGDYGLQGFTCERWKGRLCDEAILYVDGCRVSSVGELLKGPFKGKLPLPRGGRHFIIKATIDGQPRFYTDTVLIQSRAVGQAVGGERYTNIRVGPGLFNQAGYPTIPACRPPQ